MTGLNLFGKLHNAASLKVAVVGAGLAGLMAAAALRHYGAKVHVFEGGKEILGRQSNADHRLIHPSIALWPQEQPHHSTNLPVFDWCAGTCSKIIQNIKDEWEESFEPFHCEDDNPPHEPLKVTLNAPITDYTKNFSAKNGRLRCEGTPDWQSDLSFDLVIVATGYGIENAEAEKDFGIVLASGYAHREAGGSAQEQGRKAQVLHHRMRRRRPDRGAASGAR
ncbi:FAD-dependent oxidoreductase [Asticcacaulis sp. MM231]|uniref:FAD-dependent oxidoreductase n=1 Tax=Asticcacaulis sp. MM231 TaxID=3157666 RepID=UPI0032D57AF1